MNETVRIEIVAGVEGSCVAGPKPWGGGRVTHDFKVDRNKFLRALNLPEPSEVPAQTPDVCPKCGDGPLSTDADLPYCQQCGWFGSSHRDLVEAPVQTRKEKL